MVNETTGTLIQAAAEELAIVSAPDSLTASEQSSCLDRLQRLIDRSAIDSALIYGVSYSGLQTMTALQQAYTIGIDPTGSQTAQINLARPTRITAANLLITGTVRRPIKVTTDVSKWARIRYQTNYGPPDLCYFDQNFSSHGFASLQFHNIPDQNYQWEFWSWVQNPMVTSIGDPINYPPGYATYWLYALAIAIAPMFGRTPNQLIFDGLAEAKATIRGMTSYSPELETDPALREGEPYYNWLDGLEEAY